MKLNVLLLSFLVLFTGAFAAPGSEDVYASLERRLQSLKSLEIQYQAAGAVGENVVEGRMVWIRPDRFYHDTPEWTVCQTGEEQWRYLKGQNTLIREASQEQSELSPQNVLFGLKKNFHAVSLDIGDDGHRVLKLASDKPELAGGVVIEFPAKTDVPEVLAFPQPDGSTVRYRITRWDENVKPDPALFTPPTVPPENIIDFRGAGKGE